MHVPATVVPYDDGWPRAFEEIASRLRAALSRHMKVEHVGSTSVPGLAAKPIIDVDVVVHSAVDVRDAIARLRELGYQHRGDLGIIGREAFTTPSGLPYHHLYVVIEGSAPHRDHVDFRDYLRANAQAADRYANVKVRAAHLLGVDREAYVDAKSATVVDLLAEARR